jgi:histidine triad (HIT) family protein
LVEGCTFCEIVKGVRSASRVYEDDAVVAFLDFMPVSEGHTLVVTKRHYENIYEVPDVEVDGLFRAVKTVALTVKNGVGADGISIVQNNGRAAHQNIFHIHVHVIPRYEGQGGHRPLGVHTEDELEKVAKRIRQVV